MFRKKRSSVSMATPDAVRVVKTEAQLPCTVGSLRDVAAEVLGCAVAGLFLPSDSMEDLRAYATPRGSLCLDERTMLDRKFFKHLAKRTLIIDRAPLPPPDHDHDTGEPRIAPSPSPPIMRPSHAYSSSNSSARQMPVPIRPVEAIGRDALTTSAPEPAADRSSSSSSSRTFSFKSLKSSLSLSRRHHARGHDDSDNPSSSSSSGVGSAGEPDSDSNADDNSDHNSRAHSPTRPEPRQGPPVERSSAPAVQLTVEDIEQQQQQRAGAAEGRRAAVAASAPLDPVVAAACSLVDESCTEQDSAVLVATTTATSKRVPPPLPPRSHRAAPHAAAPTAPGAGSAQKQGGSAASLMAIAAFVVVLVALRWLSSGGEQSQAQQRHQAVAPAPVPAAKRAAAADAGEAEGWSVMYVALDLVAVAMALNLARLILEGECPPPYGPRELTDKRLARAAWMVKWAAEVLERLAGITTVCRQGMSCRRAYAGVIEVRDLTFVRPHGSAPFSITADVLVVTLSPLRWALGWGGLVDSVEAVGVKGTVDFAGSSPAAQHKEQQAQQAQQRQAPGGEAASEEPQRRAGAAKKGADSGFTLTVRDADVGLKFDARTIAMRLEHFKCRLQWGSAVRCLLFSNTAAGTVAGGTLRLVSNGEGRELVVKGVRVRDVLGANSTATSALLSRASGTALNVRVLLEPRARASEGPCGARMKVWVSAAQGDETPASPASSKDFTSLGARALAPLVAAVLRAALELVPSVTFQADMSEEDMRSFSALKARVSLAASQWERISA
eukprot:m51a1_g4507 hypothetical protein (781) ;mRNA; r:388417-391165